MTADEQEALSVRHGPDAIILQPLRSGYVAVYNRAGLCGIIDADLSPFLAVWRPYEPHRQRRVTLEELGL
jgi:hypothetical protein